MENFLTVLIDASGVPLKALIAEGGKILKEKEWESQALETLPSALAELLKCSGERKIGEVKNFILCLGPGSMLGTRVASVMLFTLKNLSKGARFFTYDTLQAHACVLMREGKENFAILAPSRKGFANIIFVEDGKVAYEKEVLESFKFPENSLLLKQRSTNLPDAFKGFLELKNVPVGKIFEVLQNKGDILKEVCDDAPEPVSLSEREYVKWK